MTDLRITEVSSVLPAGAKYKITEPKTVKDMDGKNVEIEGNSYNLSMADVNLRIAATEAQLAKWQAVKAEIEELVAAKKVEEEPKEI